MYKKACSRDSAVHSKVVSFERVGSEGDKQGKIEWMEQRRTSAQHVKVATL